MRKKEIIAFSIFGFLLALIRLIQNLLKTKSLAIGQPFINKTIPDNIYGQMQVLNNYYNIATIVWNVLAIFFLLYIGWKILYALLDLRYIVIGTLCMFIVSALVGFAFQPKDLTVWLSLLRNLIYSAVWIIITKIYNLAWKRYIRPNDKEISTNL